MDRLKNFFTIKSIRGAAFLIGFFTLISQITALIRDRVLVGTFGAGQILDIYYAAFKVPDLIYALISAFFSAVIIIPFLNRSIEEAGWIKANQVFSNFLNFLLLFLIPISFIIYIFIPEIVRIYVVGFSLESQNSVIILARIMLLQPIFLGISALVSCLAQTQQRFLAFSLAPVMYNFGIIIGIVYFYKDFGIKGLAFGVVLGAVFHLITQSFILMKDWRHGKFCYTSGFNFKEIYSLIKFSNLRVLGLFMQQIKYLVITFFASLFGIGALSLFQISFNLASVFMTLIVVSLTTASFPVLSRMYEEKDFRAFSIEIITSIKYLIFLTLPISFYVIPMRAHLVRIILGGSGLSWDATRSIALSFAIIISILFIFSLNYFLIRVAYARRDSGSPFFSQLFGIIVMISFIYVAIYFTRDNILNQEIMIKVLNILRLNVTDFSFIKAIILPIAICLETIVSTVLLILFLKRKNALEYFAFKDLKKTFLDSFFASTILFIFVYVLLRFFEPLLQIKIGEYTTLPGLILQTIFSSIFGFLVWYLVLKYRKNEEIKTFEDNIRNKIWKKKIEIPVNISEMHPQ